MKGTAIVLFALLVCSFSPISESSSLRRSRSKLRSKLHNTDSDAGDGDDDGDDDDDQQESNTTASVHPGNGSTPTGPCEGEPCAQKTINDEGLLVSEVDGMMEQMKQAMNPDDPKTQMREEVAALDWMEDELKTKLDGMKDENYRAKIAVDQLAVAKETTQGTAELLGDMRREMHALAAPFFEKVLEQEIAETQEKRRALLQKLEGTPKAAEPEAVKVEAVEKPEAPSAPYNPWVLFFVIIVLLLVGSAYGYSITKQRSLTQ